MTDAAHRLKDVWMSREIVLKMHTAAGATPLPGALQGHAMDALRFDLVDGACFSHGIARLTRMCLRIAELLLIIAIGGGSFVLGFGVPHDVVQAALLTLGADPARWVAILAPGDLVSLRERTRSGRSVRASMSKPFFS